MKAEHLIRFSKAEEKLKIIKEQLRLKRYLTSSTALRITLLLSEVNEVIF